MPKIKETNKNLTSFLPKKQKDVNESKNASRYAAKSPEPHHNSFSSVTTSSKMIYFLLNPE